MSGGNETSEGPGMIFEILKSALGGGKAIRLGKLALPNRVPIPTPNFVAATSRGSVPHITPDNVTRYTSFGAAYMALEDFVEKKDPPIYQMAGSAHEPLRAFTAFPANLTTILASRRIPSIITPLGNGNKHITVFTSTGFRNIPVSDYIKAVADLRPDIAIPLAELPHKSNTPQSKRLVRMVERTEDWLNEFFESRTNDTREDKPLVFAPILPVERPIQWQYLDHLAEDVVESLSGLAIYDGDLIPELQHYPSLQSFPRLLLQPPASPHHLLRHISLGADLFLLPFLNTSSDAGIALSFTFPPHTSPSSDLLPLGIDIWSPDHKASLDPLMQGCKCYACTKHHRAFVHHLLNAKEMLGWTLLQIHNHHVMSEFFRGVREALAKGETAFDDAARAFRRVYELELPPGTGARPRARGYHFKSEGGDPALNESAWSKELHEGPAEGETPITEVQG